MMPRWRTLAVVLLLTGCAVLIWKQSGPSPGKPAPESTVVQQEIIPPGIVVTESSPVVPPPPSTDAAPGDRLLGDYGRAESPPQNDLVLLAHAISNFLLIDKQATDRPLSANAEWSAALRGKRPGTEPWLSDHSPVLDSEQRLIDRWQTPLFFHALGNKQWEIRSAGPDRTLWTDDDLLEKVSG
jgi:hypothetical protein